MVPKKFWLAGIEIEVELDPNMYAQTRRLGEAKYPDQKIILDCSMQSIHSMEQTFLHELMHWIFYIMSEPELRNNEKLIDLLAHFIHQSRRSASEYFTEDELVTRCKK